MLLSLLQFGLLVEYAMVFAAYDVSSITCVCSTTHCTEHRMSTCNTTGVCFSQYLDRKDGSHPVVRGCIASKTPLLCENRRPAVSQASWPILVCCDSNLCNRDVVPTPPPFGFLRDSKNNQQDGNFATDVADGMTQHQQNKGAWKDSLKEMLEAQTSKNPEGSGSNSLLLDTRDRRNNSSNQGFPKIVSPVYVSVLVLGIASLVVIGIVAAVVLRRNNKFYAEQYGALRERNEEYFKHPLNAPSSSSSSPTSFEEEEEEDGECRDIVVQNPASCCSHQKRVSSTDTHYHIQRDT